MNALIEFLRARLDEDEATARATLWEGSGNRPDWDLPASATVDVGGHEFYAEDRTVAQHIARHDPARVVRQIAAIRAVVGLHERLGGPAPFCITCDAPEGIPGRPEGCDTLRHVATIWSDHPVYRQEWAL